MARGIGRVVPPAGRAVERWHVSPLVDVVAYHFSWAWVLVPLALAGPRFPLDFLAVYLLVVTLNFTHRHFSFPYVYLDRQVFSRNRLRFSLTAALVVGACLASPWAWERADGRALISAIAFVAVLWNIWHVYMQKYGLLRLYAAKGGAPPSRRVPGWVDRLLVFGWVPLYFVYLGPTYRHVLVERATRVNVYLLPLVDGLARAQPLLLGPAISLVAVSLVLFLRHELGAHGRANVPRLSMAAGLTLLGASFLLLDPVKVYIAFGFSHAVEYMVFVWAFQRRRYRVALPHRPLLGRALTRPWLAYPLFALAVGGAYFYLAQWGRYVAVGSPRAVLAGVPAARWIFFWSIYQSMAHFYFDGFLWKMRLPAVRASI